MSALPSLENLRCFLAAAETLNFRRASSIVALTPTAFGARIKQLEEQLGQPLFERTTRRVTLTRAGQALVPEARGAIDQARRCIDIVHEDAEPPARFTLGTRFELGMSWIVPALTPPDVFPTWTIDVHCGSGPEIIDRLTAGDVDTIVTSAPVARAGWEQHVLHSEVYAFVATPELLRDKPLDVEADAVHHVLYDVDRSLPLGRYLLDAPGATLSFGDIRTVGAGAAILAFVQAGRGVGVLPEYMVAPDVAAGRLVRLLPERRLLEDSFRLIYSQRHPLARAFLRLADYLRERPLS